MSTPRCHDRTGRLLVTLLLAAYAPIGVLGYGLHRLWGCEHAHECGCSQTCACDHHDCTAHEHSHPAGQPPEGATLTRGTSGHDCAICSFLAQAQSPAVVAASPEVSQPLPATPCDAQPLILAAAVDVPQARGPPALV